MSYVLDTASPLTMVLAETTGTESIYYLSKHYEEALAYRFAA